MTRDVADNFNIKGPHQLNAVDWSVPVHRTMVMASLVQGVYVLENDRKNKGSPPLAPPWWTSFNFELEDTIEEKSKSICGTKSICGAIYKLKDGDGSGSPKCVVAFRGTQISNVEDLKLDCNILTNKLKRKTLRVGKALRSVKKSIKTHQAAHTWLAGHSLGAAIALMVGKQLMAKEKMNLQTYLFNPPISSAVCINTEPCCTVALFCLNRGRAMLESLLCWPNPFDAIRDWEPHLYVNPKDPICMGYINYFGNRDRWGKRGLREVDETASRVCWCPTCSFRGVEPMHLLASAELNINKDESKGHSLQQWYDENIHNSIETKKYPPKKP